MTENLMLCFMIAFGGLFQQIIADQSTYLTCDSDLSDSSIPVTLNVTINLRTPNYPNPYRSPFHTCVRNFVAPAGSFIRLMFTNGYIDGDLELYDGTFDGANTPSLIKRMSGDLTADQMFAAMSTQNKLAVVFKNMKLFNTGFNAQIDTFLNSGECPNGDLIWNLESDGEKIITSNWNPKMPLGTRNCSWTLTTNPDYRIKLALSLKLIGSDALTILDSSGSELKSFTSADNSNSSAFYVSNLPLIKLFYKKTIDAQGSFAVIASSYPIPRETINCPDNTGSYSTTDLLSGVVMYTHANRSILSYPNNLNCKLTGTMGSPFVYQYPVGKSVAVQIETDGSTVAQGFGGLVQALDCRCPSVPIILNEENPNATFTSPGYSNSYSPGLGYCNNMNCVINITAPSGYRVQVTINVDLRSDSSDSLILRNGNAEDGYILGRFNGSTTASVVSIANAIRATFTTDNIADAYYSRYGIFGYTADATLKKLPSSSPTVYSLSSDQPFRLITSKSFNSQDQYWTVTAEPGKQVHLYLFGNSVYTVNIYVIDGTDASGTLLIQVKQFPLMNGPMKAISSSKGSLTVLFDGRQFFDSTDSSFLFTQLENDPSVCGTPEMVFQASDGSATVNVKISNGDTTAASCPAVLVTGPGMPYNPGMQLSVNNLQGSMVLYGGVDYRQSSSNEIVTFSSMNDVIPALKVAGKIFLILLSPGSSVNIDFQPVSYFGFQTTFGGTGAKGIMMSENYPNPNTAEITDSFSFFGDRSDFYEYSLNVLRYDLGKTGSLTVKSSALDSGFSKTLTNSGGSTPMQFCAMSFKVDYKSNGLGQKGFILRYDVGKTCSQGSSTAWIWIVVVSSTVALACMAVAFGICLRRHQLRQLQRNNARYVAHPVYAVPSSSIEVSPPPSYLVASSTAAPVVSNPVQMDMKTSHK